MWSKGGLSKVALHGWFGLLCYRWVDWQKTSGSVSSGWHLDIENGSLLITLGVGWSVLENSPLWIVFPCPSIFMLLGITNPFPLHAWTLSSILGCWGALSLMVGNPSRISFNQAWLDICKEGIRLANLQFILPWTWKKLSCSPCR